jgi:hypothetical protein
LKEVIENAGILSLEQKASLEQSVRNITRLILFSYHQFYRCCSSMIFYWQSVELLSPQPMVSELQLNVTKGGCKLNSPRQGSEGSSAPWKH